MLLMKNIAVLLRYLTHLWWEDVMAYVFDDHRAIFAGITSAHQSRDCVRQLGIPSCRMIPSCCTTTSSLWYCRSHVILNIWRYLCFYDRVAICTVALKGHHYISFSLHYINFDLCEKNIMWLCIHNYLACKHNYLACIHKYLACIHNYLACIHN